MKKSMLPIILSIATSVVAQQLPEDDCRQWHWIIDAVMPESSGPGELVDLSDATTVRTYEPHYLSAYLYCAANPVMLTDPTGLSTRVVDNGNGTYKVIGGALDGDLRIFLCENDHSETGIPIGMTPVETSFYNSDKNGGTWMERAIIDPNDNSGISFINL